MIVVCPKYSYYTALSDEVKSAVRAKIREVMSEYVSGRPTIFLEDTMAKEIIDDSGYIVTITDERDYSVMVGFDYYDTASRMKDLYSSYRKQSSPFVKFENPPMALMMQNREEYKTKRIAAYEKRLAETVRYLAEKEKAMLTFLGNTNSKSRLELKPIENDGILNITYNLSTNVANCYYSGTWVDVDMAKQILGGLYG